MQPVNIYSFRKKVSIYKNQFVRYLKRVQKIQPPTFNSKDIRRISKHLNMRPKDFKERWLKHEKKDKDWVNISQPCQFLDLSTNMCSIYEVRPADCAGFPHLTKKKMVDYMHVHQQNIQYCPATYKMVEKMMEKIKIW